MSVVRRRRPLHQTQTARPRPRREVRAQGAQQLTPPVPLWRRVLIQVVRWLAVW